MDPSHAIKVEKMSEDDVGGRCDMYGQNRNAYRGSKRKD